jgi:hypothetical protein
MGKNEIRASKEHNVAGEPSFLSRLSISSSDQALRRWARDKEAPPLSSTSQFLCVSETSDWQTPRFLGSQKEHADKPKKIQKREPKMGALHH